MRYRLNEADRRVLWRQMRAPAFSFAVLLVLLAVNLLLGTAARFHGVGFVEAAVVLCMVLVILLVSMEVLTEPPLIRLFSVLGFFWVAIMFGMTLVDYLAR